MTAYAELLRDPRWQKKRLEVLDKAGWACDICYEDEMELQVHHKRYRWNAKPWEYDSNELRCLCKKCHEEETAAWKFLKDEMMLVGTAAEFAPLIAGFISERRTQTGIVGDKSSWLDSDLTRAGRIAAQVERLPLDLLADVVEALESANKELAARVASFGRRRGANGFPTNA